MTASTPRSVIIIGAGWSGLAAAKTYLQINPSISLTVLDESTSVGGVWSTPRLYPGLISQSPIGLFEYSDLSMLDPQDPTWKPCPAERVQTYLQQYAEKHELLRHIQFNTRVASVEKATDGRQGWSVRIAAAEGAVLHCDKLLVATGLYSVESYPDIAASSDFAGPVLHSKALGTQHARLTAPRVANVVVVGGCKTAVEAAALCVAAGKHVDWVVRPSAQGVPITMLDPRAAARVQAFAYKRLASVATPSVFGARGFWHAFLHSGRWVLGNWLYRRYWRFVSDLMSAPFGFDKSENGRRLKPRLDGGGGWFYALPYVSLVFSDNPIVDEIHRGDNVTVHRDTPTRLSADGMRLASGATIPCDAVLYATGWSPPTRQIFALADALALGLPVQEGEEGTAEHADRWARLDAQADAAVTEAFPHLALAPPTQRRPASASKRWSPYRLYKGCVPVNGDPSVAFTGHIAAGNTPQMCEILALYSVAHLEGLLPRPLPAVEDMEADVARVQAWRARRYGGRAESEPAVLMEVQGFFDELLGDLGVAAERKRKGWLGWLWEWCGTYLAKDYDGVVEEFSESSQKRK